MVLDYLQRLGRPEGHYAEHKALARGFSDASNELNIAALMTSQVSTSPKELSEAEPTSLDEGQGTGDIERCSMLWSFSSLEPEQRPGMPCASIPSGRAVTAENSPTTRTGSLSCNTRSVFPLFDTSHSARTHFQNQPNLR
ncbi:MAG TPA: hypothetical protein VH186_39270 [Chloroflexia bacterium]|nr:hypothetical protein [Chloroflexia bacterium]